MDDSYPNEQPQRVKAPDAACVHIVDDDPGIRESLKQLVAGAGYRVHCYASGAAFRDCCAEACGCALVDLRLNDMSGIDLQREIIARARARST